MDSDFESRYLDCHDSSAKFMGSMERASFCELKEVWLTNVLCKIKELSLFKEGHSKSNLAIFSQKWANRTYSFDF